MSQITLLSGPERRRRWSFAERGRILTAAFSPGAVVSEVARQFDVATSLIYKWRRQAETVKRDVAFAQAILIDEDVSSSPPPRHAQQRGCDDGHTEQAVVRPVDQRQDDRDGGILGRREVGLRSAPVVVAITVELSAGRRISIGAAASAALVTATLRALR